VNPVARLVRGLSVDTWRDLDAEQAARDRAALQGGPGGAGPGGPGGPGRYDFWPLIVLVTVAVALTLQEYVGERDFFRRHFPRLAAGDYGELRTYAWWSGWRFAGYVLLPVAVILCTPGQRLRDYYLSLRQLGRHYRIYLLLFLLVLPFVIGAAQFRAFYHTYPFYKWANRSALDFWAWEALYALQFVSLEFFFRGFMLHGLRRRLGASAVFVMVVPYCMIHYGKPMAETFGAIVAGLVLGTLAMRTRSIWGGALIHIAVALTMDLLAVSQCPPADSGLRCPSHGAPLD
jgi:membrane protease YdiL (CAAX protease family)